MYCEGTVGILDENDCRAATHVFIYTHTLRVLPIHFGRETVPSARDHDLMIWVNDHSTSVALVLPLHYGMYYVC